MRENIFLPLSQEINNIRNNIFVSESIVNRVNDEGNTLLHLSCAIGNLDYVFNLLLEGADTNIQNKNGNTPLHFASVVGNIEIVRILLLGGAVTDKKNCIGNVPAECALVMRDERMFHFLEGGDQ